ncbi:uncharacterized protein [Pseudochaenichthys georgianus]|uniref:uncharacterized protein isoform X3 n=2 Tax=Pseudochaenichthys georgianus TaxID=52239 RepID=UPI0039C149CA
MPRGSTKKTCPFCLGILFCAQKICAHCLKEQPKKQRLEKKLKMFDEKRKDWVSGRKKNNNIGSIKDEAIILLEKLHAIGFKPVLLLCKKTKKKERKCEILTPRCTLTAFSQDYLEKIGTIYEFFCKVPGPTDPSFGSAALSPHNAEPEPAFLPTEGGWTQDSTGQGVKEDPDEERVTLNITPCDPSEPTNNWQEAGTTESQVLETSIVQVEVLKTPPVKQCTATEVRQEEPSQQDMEVEQATENVTHATTTEGPDCSYHTHLEAFPIRSVISERMRKGEAEMLVEWEPCPICGKEWANSWQLKTSLE